MKAFLKKFKTSMALDRDGQPAKRSEPAATRPGEESLNELDHSLRESRTGDEAPPDLHGGIMRAVRTSARKSEPAPLAVWWPRVAAAAFVLMVGAGVFWSLNRAPVKVVDAGTSTETPSLTAAIEQGHVLTQSAPEAALRPLSGELDLLNDDIQNAVNFVVASVPRVGGEAVGQ